MKSFTSGFKPACNPGKQRGQVFVVLALSLVVLIGALGLAIDSGLGYLIKARLNTAVDAAAVAGARASSQGASQSEQRANAAQAARDFFAANYPRGYLGSTVALDEPRISFDSPAPGAITVDVSAKARTPVAFMRVLGFDKLDIAAASQTVRKDVDMAFVIDTSGSVAPVAAKVRQSASTFLDKFSPTTNRVSLIHFSSGAEVDVPIRTGPIKGFDRQRLVNSIKGYNFAGLTNSSEGFWHGRDQLNRVAPRDRSTLRLIVFFSDGTPNTFASRFAFRNPQECNVSGALATGDGSATGLPSGLWDQDRQSAMLPGGCDKQSKVAQSLSAKALPDWYNAHGANDREFRVVANAPRVVTNDTSTPAATWVNVNRASRNLVEAMAAKARAEGIRVFPLGLGPLLRLPSAVDSNPEDTGENLLKCMANTSDAPRRCRSAGAGQPVGLYCHAETADELQPCFAMLAAEALRITR